MKVIILGAGGLVGSHAARLWPQRKWDCVSLPHQDLDITHGREAADLLETVKPDWVFNAAAISGLEACDRDPVRSRAVNVEAPARWAACCHERGIRFCHIGSDYVFDGKSAIPYVETDPARPLSLYGEQKREGEEAVLAFPGHLVLRVAWVFGQGGKTFMSQIPRLLMERPELCVARGRRGSCLNAGYGVGKAGDLMARGASGLFHLVHRGEVTWKRFAEVCLEELKRRGEHPRCEEIREVSAEETGVLTAPRPEYTALDVGKIEHFLGEDMTPWDANCLEP